MNIILLASEDSWWVVWLKAFWAWVWGWFYIAITAFALWCFDMLLYMIPKDWLPAIDKLLVFFEYLNCWVAVDFGISMFTIYLLFLTVFIVIKTILKLIPTVG